MKLSYPFWFIWHILNAYYRLRAWLSDRYDLYLAKRALKKDDFVDLEDIERILNK